MSLRRRLFLPLRRQLISGVWLIRFSQVASGAIVKNVQQPKSPSHSAQHREPGMYRQEQVERPPGRRWGKEETYPLVSGISSKLTSTVRHNPHTISPVPTHKPSPSFLLPHFAQSAPNARIISLSRPLNLEQYLHPLQRRDYRSGYRARDSTRKK
jgi:hypothetical protein